MDNVYTVEESDDLLHYIYPNWPDQRGMRKPYFINPQEWLKQYREGYIYLNQETK